jgi:hypothetical protein
MQTPTTVSLPTGVSVTPATNLPPSSSSCNLSNTGVHGRLLQSNTFLRPELVFGIG